MNDHETRLVSEWPHDHSRWRCMRILRSVGSSLQPSRVLLGMVAATLLVIGGRTWDAMLTPAAVDGEVAVGIYEATQVSIQKGLVDVVNSTVELRPFSAVQSVLEIVAGTPARLFAGGHTWFLLLFGLWVLIVASIVGGAICRTAAVYGATGEVMPPRQSLRYTRERWGRFIGAVGIPLVVAGVLTVVLMLFGLLFMSAPIVDLLGGVLYGVAVIVGLVLACVLVGYLFSGPMLLPAVAVENCDGADAGQRAWSYVIAHPLAMFGYLLMAGIGLVLGSIVVAGMLFAAVALTGSLVSQGMVGSSLVPMASDVPARSLWVWGVAEEATTWHGRWTGELIGFWLMVVRIIFAGWIVSYLCTASTEIYLLMRWRCDGQEPDEVWWPGMIEGTTDAATPPHADS